MVAHRGQAREDIAQIRQQLEAMTAPDLPPVPGEHPTIGRDYEYKRLGTASILAGLDLQDGNVTARVERRHRSREFIQLLEELDVRYPAEAVIRLNLDNHSAHISKETRAYLATRPNRFRYVHTPKHDSWLNLVETLFGKMARTLPTCARSSIKQRSASFRSLVLSDRRNCLSPRLSKA